jgi:hypothetical protein
MTKPGVPEKGSMLLDKICRDRIPRRHKKTFKKAVKEKKELTEAQKEHMAKMTRLANEKRAAVAAELKEIEEEGKSIAEDDSDISDEDDSILTKNEKKLKDDLRWVLQKLGGRKKILTMAKKSDALKVVIIKELLKVEVKELEARLRSKVPQGGQQGFFLVISGLEDKKIVQKKLGFNFNLDPNNNDNTIDIIDNNEES